MSDFDALDKVKTFNALSKELTELKNKGKRVVHCHGVFDLVHLGHMRHLQAAKEFGDILVVTVTADGFVNRGPGRPIFTSRLRAEALANLAITDFVAIVDHPTAIEAIKAIRPNFYVKGGEYRRADLDVTGMISHEETAVKEGGGEIVFTDELTFSSSKLLNLHLDSYPEKTMEYIKGFASKYSIETITQWLKKASELKVLVIGDTIIDQYFYCGAMGKSAKENIVAHKFISSEDFGGGIIATSNHLAQLCDNVELLTSLGEIDSWEAFVRQGLNPKIRPHIIKRADRRTTVKRRYVSEDGSKKNFEVCWIDDEALTEREDEEALEFLRPRIADYDLVVVNDFGHGLITKKMTELICNSAKCLALNVQTNSANIGFNLVTKYLSADMVCIDEHEMRLATKDKHRDLGQLLLRVSSFLDCKQVLVTRGSQGSLCYSKESGFLETPAFTNYAVDKIGAGDAFFAYASPCYALGLPPEVVAFVGNVVGALKVQIIGNREAVKLPELLKFITRLLKV